MEVKSTIITFVAASLFLRELVTSAMSADAAPDAGVAETAPSAAIDEIAPSPPSRSVTRSRKVVKLIDALRQADGDGAFVRRSIGACQSAVSAPMLCSTRAGSPTRTRAPLSPAGRHELPLLDPFLLLDDFNAKAPAGGRLARVGSWQSCACSRACLTSCMRSNCACRLPATPPPRPSDVHLCG